MITDTMNLFAYGTLMDTEIMRHVSGAEYQGINAILKDYIRLCVKGAVYPGIIPCKNTSVQGIVYFDITEESLSRVDAFEDDMYYRDEVIVEGAENQPIKAFAYIVKTDEVQKLTEQEWDYQEFHKKNRNLFLNGYSGFDQVN